MATRILLPTGDFESDVWATEPAGHGSYWDLLQAIDANTVRFTDPGGYIGCTIQAMPSGLASAFNSVTVYAAWTGTGAGATVFDTCHNYLKLGGVKYQSPAFAVMGSSSYSWALPLNPASSLPWSLATLNSIQDIGQDMTDYIPASGIHSLNALYAIVNYDEVAPGFAAARDAGGRRVWLRRRPGGRIELRGPVSLLDHVAGGRILLSHVAGPESAGLGWRTAPYERRPLWIESGPSWNPDDMTVTLICLDHRPKLCMMFDSGYATAADGNRSGLLRMAPGGVFTFTRSTTAEVLDATGRLVQVDIDVEAYADRGLVAQGGRTNYLKNSAFSLGVDTNWTSSGEGSNGSNITANTTAGLWDPTLSANCLSIQSGSPIHAADLKHTAAAVASLSGVKSLAVYHVDTDGPLSVSIQRSIDSKYFRASDSTWQASLTWNSLPERDEWSRDTINGIDLGGSATSVTVVLGVPTASGVAGQLNLVAQVQLENAPFPASPILTTSAAVTRGADAVAVSNDAGTRSLTPNQFTTLVELEPFWSAADLPSGAVKTAQLVYYDDDNNLLVTYEEASGAWIGALTADGTTYTVSLTGSPVVGTRYTVATRFIGHRGELGRAPYSFSILVDGVESDVAIATSPMTESLTSQIYFGHAAGSDQWDGYVRQRMISPQVLTDIEIQRGI